MNRFQLSFNFEQLPVEISGEEILADLLYPEPPRP